MNLAEPTEQSIMGKKQSQKGGDGIPPGAKHRHWTLRADNRNNFFGKIRLSESPLYLDLDWRQTAKDTAQHVGIFRLDMRELLEGGYIRHTPIGTKGDDVLLRIVRSDTGEFFVQTNNSGPSYPLKNPIT